MPAQRKRKSKAPRNKSTQSKPVIYYSEKPVSLREWRAGKNSPNPKPLDPK